MAAIDVFGLPEFSMANLTAAINALPYKPKLLGSMGVFQSTPINTTVAKVEKREGKLSLLMTSARGTVGNVRSQPDRVMRTFGLPHVPQYQTIMADDIQNIRAFDSETELEAVQQVVNDNLQGCRDNHETTHEYHRIGAIKGTILDGDGATTLYNLFTEFDESQVVLPYVKGTNSPKSLADAIIRDTADALGNDMFSGIVALCGDTFFTEFTTESAVKDTYLNWSSNLWSRQAQLGPEYGPYANGFEWGGVLWMNYRGTIGDVAFVPTAEAYTFPLGVNRMFQEICGPGDSMGAANTRGQLIYASQHVLPHDVGVELKTTSDCLMLNTRPAACLKIEGTFA
jgi:hypothetical protein